MSDDKKKFCPFNSSIMISLYIPLNGVMGVYFYCFQLLMLIIVVTKSPEKIEKS